MKLDNMDFLDEESYEESYDKWECKDGTIMEIHNMGTTHITNCIFLIERSIKENKPWRTEYLEPLKNELQRRRRCNRTNSF